MSSFPNPVTYMHMVNALSYDPLFKILIPGTKECTYICMCTCIVHYIVKKLSTKKINILSQKYDSLTM